MYFLYIKIIEYGHFGFVFYSVLSQNNRMTRSKIALLLPFLLCLIPLSVAGDISYPFEFRVP